MTDEKLNAFKETLVTDGVQTFTKFTFDAKATVTPEDLIRVKEALNNGGTDRRIQRMQSGIDALDETNPAIKLHADAIRAILLGLESKRSLSREELAALGKANMLWQKIVVIRDVMPLAKKGARFKPGKPKGAIGIVAKMIAAYLQKNPAATALEVWDALAKTPPKDYEFRNSPRLGKYIERGALPVMEWRRFQNLVSQHRPKK